MSHQAPQATSMFAEASEAPDVVARQLRANAPLIRDLGQRLRDHPPLGIVTYARGSSDHAATFAKYVFETRTRILTTSAAPSMASVYGDAPNLSGMLALAISQSGRSPDILSAMAAAKSAGALTVALVNAEDSELASLCELTIPLRAGIEKSIAATKSYIGALSAILQLASIWSNDASLEEALEEAPELLRKSLDCDWSPLVERFTLARNLYVIGRGPGFAIAQEAALKLKETCGIQAEAFSAAEVRHGPMALVEPDFPLLVFRQSDETASGVDELVADLLERRANVFVAGGGARGATILPVPSAHSLIEPMLEIAAFYRAVNALSLARGFDPDRPPHLKKVTETL